MRPNFSINRWFMATVMATTLTITGCSMTGGYLGHSIQTEVQLSKKNFKVIKSVTGEAKATYFLGVFGPSKANLVDQARRDMIEKAGLVGTSSAVINITTDIKKEWNPIFNAFTVYVSGEVIEFLE
jgi:hypothetical protein